MSKNIADSVIMGVSKVGQVSANFAAANGRLDEKMLEACDTVHTLRDPHLRYNR